MQTPTTRSRLNCILPRPLPSSSLVSSTIGLVDMSDFGNEWIIRVRVCQHRTDRQQYCPSSLVSKIPTIIEKKTQKHVTVSIAVYDTINESVPLEIVKAGDHWSLKMSKQILPLAFMLG